jgi:type VI secretion system Hcp family effector
MAAYMKIDGPSIPGQATDSNHKDWIPALSISQSVSRPLGHSSGLTGQSSVDFHDIVVCTKLGKHVPELAKAVASGTDFDTVELEVCADQGERAAYYRIKLEKVHVTSFNVSNFDAGGQGDTMQIGLHFDKIEWVFTHWAGKQNKGDITTTWNVAENVE